MAFSEGYSQEGTFPRCIIALQEAGLYKSVSKSAPFSYDSYKANLCHFYATRGQKGTMWVGTHESSKGTLPRIVTPKCPCNHQCIFFLECRTNEGQPCLTIFFAVRLVNPFGSHERR